VVDVCFAADADALEHVVAHFFWLLAAVGAAVVAGPADRLVVGAS
jgi:hypothetical protein